MPADHSFVVRRHPDGGYTISESVASETGEEERDPEAPPDSRRYASITDAVAAGLAGHSDHAGAAARS